MYFFFFYTAKLQFRSFLGKFDWARTIFTLKSARFQMRYLSFHWSYWYWCVIVLCNVFLLRVLSKFGPLFAISFLLFWFPWGPPGLQFILCLCFYDGFLTLVDLNHLALLADLALSAQDRTRLNGYCSMFSVVGCLSVFVSYSVWDKDNIASFRLFCFCLSMFAVVGFLASSLFLRNHLKCEKVKVDTPVDDIGKRWAALCWSSRL